MTMKTLGRLIGETREARKITQRVLSMGLCSMQTLSNIEADERIPDVFILDYLLERLGLAADEIETILYDDEYGEIKLRRDILLAAERGEWAYVDDVLRERFSKINAKDTIKLQFYYKIMAIRDKDRKDYKSCLENILQALACTQPKFHVEKRNMICMSIHELQILCMLAETYMDLENPKEAEKVLAFLMWYTEEMPIQEMGLVKIYPKVMYLVSKTERNAKSKVEYLLRYERAFHLMIDNDSTAFLPEIMEILIKEYEEMNLHQKAVVLKKQLEALSGFCEEFGGEFYLSESPIKWFKDSYRKYYLLFKELIKEERSAKNLKYKEFVEGIYEDVETLVRIENGIQNPSHKKYAFLMERLNLPKEKYHSLQIREGETVFKIDRKITSLYAKHEYENAKIELEKIKLLMETGNSINQQYLMKQEALLDLELKQIEVEDFLQRIKDALQKTYAGDVEKPQRVPTIEEIKLFNHIGVSYRRQKKYEDGIVLYERLLECYKNSSIEACDYYRGLILLLRNYILLIRREWQNR